MASNLDVDIDTLARTIYGEARGEPFLGQAAVAWVVKNRAARSKRFGKSITDVCLKPKQFSCWNANDPNRLILMAATLQTQRFARAYGIACLVLTSDISDPTQGADHYHRTDISPSWSKDMAETVVIGAHRFLREAA